MSGSTLSTKSRALDSPRFTPATPLARSRLLLRLRHGLGDRKTFSSLGFTVPHFVDDSPGFICPNKTNPL